MKTSSRLSPMPPSSSSSSLPARPTNGQALLVLGGARRLADEHQLGVGVAAAEHDPGAAFVQRAARAAGHAAVELHEQLAALLRRSRLHDPRVFRPDGGYPLGTAATHSGVDRRRCNLDRRQPEARAAWAWSERAGWAPPWPPRCARRPPGRGAGRPRRGAERLPGDRPLRARRRDPRGAPRRWRAPRRSWATRAAPPRSPPSQPAGAEAFGLHPLQSFAEGAGAEAFEGAGCAVAGDTPAALGLAARAGARARHDALRDRRRRAGRLPRGRLDGLQLPGHAPGGAPSGWPAAPGSSRARPGRCSRRSCGAPSRSGPSRGPSARSPGPSRAETGTPCGPSGPPWPRRRPSCWHSSTSWSSTRASWPGRERRHEDCSHERRAARRCSSPSAGPAARSAWCRRWATSTRATSP